MIGVVFDGKRTEVVDDLEIRAPGPGEVLVAVAAAGLCHIDLSVVDGTIPFPLPVVLGHEGAGVVETIGAGVTHVAPGDHVSLSTLASCFSETLATKKTRFEVSRKRSRISARICACVVTSRAVVGSSAISTSGSSTSAIAIIARWR